MPCLYPIALHNMTAIRRPAGTAWARMYKTGAECLSLIICEKLQLAFCAWRRSPAHKLRQSRPVLDIRTESAYAPRAELAPPLAARTKKPAGAQAPTGKQLHGGGAEDRTPVQNSPLAGVSKLSHRLDLGRVTLRDPRSASQLVRSYRAAYQRRPHEHLPKMTSPREQEKSPL